MIRRPPRSTQSRSSAASDVYKRQLADAGYEPGDITINVWSPNGRYVQDATVTQAVAQELEAFGFAVELRLFGDFSEYIEIAFGEDRGDMMLLGWAPSTLEAEGGLYQVLHGD